VKNWQDDLALMVNLLTGGMTRPTEEEFVTPAAHADCFRLPAAFEYVGRMEYFAKALETSGRLTGSTADTLGTVVEFSRRIHQTTAAWQRLVWPWFRSSAGLTPGGAMLS
jgi:hypothetical protein